MLAVVDSLVSDPTAWEETGTLLAASFVGGIARFVLLRWWVFAGREPAAAQHS